MEKNPLTHRSGRLQQGGAGGLQQGGARGLQQGRAVYPKASGEAGSGMWEVKYEETYIITWVPAQSNVWGRQRAPCHPWALLSELGWRETHRQTHI